MGIDIDRTEFDKNDTLQFKEKLKEQLVSLKAILDKPSFGKINPCLGAELELYLVDKQ